MTLAVGLLIGTLLVLWLAPAALVMGLRRRVEPRATLTAWLVLVGSTFLPWSPRSSSPWRPVTARRDASWRSYSTAGRPSGMAACPRWMPWPDWPEWHC